MAGSVAITVGRQVDSRAHYDNSLSHGGISKSFFARALPTHRRRRRRHVAGPQQGVARRQRAVGRRHVGRRRGLMRKSLLPQGVAAFDRPRSTALGTRFASPHVRLRSPSEARRGRLQSPNTLSVVAGTSTRAVGVSATGVAPCRRTFPDTRSELHPHAPCTRLPSPVLGKCFTCCVSTSGSGSCRPC